MNDPGIRFAEGEGESATEASSSRRTPIHRNPYVWMFVLGCLTLTALRPFLRHVPEAPPVLGPAPEYRMVDQGGRPFGSRELRGQVYVANFFFTSCASTCPALMSSMKTLQDRLRAAGERDIHLVSISVDPERDTPERLREYASRYGADPSRWSLLAGERDRLEEVVAGGFKVPVGKPEHVTPELLDIAHSGKLVLVDRRGRIRGYYGSDPTGIDEVFHRSQHVRDQG